MLAEPKIPSEVQNLKFRRYFKISAPTYLNFTRRELYFSSVNSEA